MTSPETRYAKSGDVHIAYQAVGQGPRHLVVQIAGPQPPISNALTLEADLI
jgi:hypothetical protein